MELDLRPIAEAPRDAVIALHNDPRVRRHLPLAQGPFDIAAHAAWLEAKERSWRDSGYGPWAIFAAGDFAGWGGLQNEGGEADLAIVLFPRYWGLGRVIVRQAVDRAFGTWKLAEITALLPIGRPHVRGLLRLGFVDDGPVLLAGVAFRRFRLGSGAVASPDRRG